MKKTIRGWLMPILIALAVTALFTHGSFSQAKPPVVRETIVYSQFPVDLRLLQVDDEYSFVGTVITCRDSVLMVQALMVVDSTDSVRYQATPVHYTASTFDSCTAETFAYGVHTGQLRRILAGTGLAQIVIFGDRYAVVVSLSTVGEAVLLQALPKLEKDGI